MAAAHTNVGLMHKQDREYLNNIFLSNANLNQILFDSNRYDEAWLHYKKAAQIEFHADIWWNIVQFILFIFYLFSFIVSF